MRKKYSPLVTSCLTRLTAMIDAAELCDDCEQFPELHGSRILTPAEVAYVLDCSSATVSQLVKEKRLNAQNLRGVIRFLEDDLRRFLRQVPETRQHTVAV